MSKRQKSKKMAYMPWFPADFLADVLLLEDVEELMYRRLLDYQWLHGSVPRDPEKRARAARMPRKLADRCWEQVAGYFPDEGGEGLVNGRLEREREFSAEVATRRSEAARTANEARWGHRAGPEPDHDPEPGVDPKRIRIGSEPDTDRTTDRISNGSHPSPSPSRTTPTVSQRARDQLADRFAGSDLPAVEAAVGGEGDPDATARLILGMLDGLGTRGGHGVSPRVMATAIADAKARGAPLSGPVLRSFVERIEQAARRRPPGPAGESPGQAVYRLAMGEEAA